MRSFRIPRGALSAGNLVRAALIGPVVLGLAGCGSVEQVVEPCCYDGPVASARFQQLDLTLENGRTASFGEIFAGFRPSEQYVNRALPFQRAEIELVHLLHLRPLMHRYDANGNTVLEEPELAVLYVVETARALGHPVDHVGAGEPIGALAIAAADVGGMLDYIDANAARMSPDARRLYRELDYVADDMRRLHSEGIDDNTRIPPK